MKKSVYAIATMDTKGHEIRYVVDRIKEAGIDALALDAGTGSEPVVEPDIRRDVIASFHPNGPEAVLSHSDRGQAVTAMSEALVAFIQSEFAEGKISGLVGIGGGGGTAIAAPAMRALPIGIPKLLVSTLASGNTAPYMGCCDIMMMFSVVDIAGLNNVSRRVLGNAAYAMAGMVSHDLPAVDTKTTLGMTMFGVTTPCVTAVREKLESLDYDCLVFHATGTGGQAMEKLVASGMIDGVLDITTTEVADEVVGGVFPAGKNRFDEIIDKGIPFVMSVGALDMVNFGARDTVPESFQDRTLYVHNPQVTLMRTTPEENRRCARWIARKVNRSQNRFTLLLPEKGVSMIDAPGQPFYDPEADAALFDELESAIEQTELRVVKRLPYHINDPPFSSALVDAFLDMQVQ